MPLESTIEHYHKETASISIFNTNLDRKSSPATREFTMAVLYFVCLCQPDSLSNYVTSVDLFRSWKTGVPGKESNTQAIKLANQQIGRTDHATAILFVRNDAQTGRFSFVLW